MLRNTNSRYRVRPKYGNVKTASGFDSKREEKRYGELVLLEKIGEISDLKRQVKIEIIPKTGKERACHWIADFVYQENGVEVFEDCKGFKTREYILKRKLVNWLHGKQIRET